MSALLVVAAALSFLTAAAHALPGGREILRPALVSPLGAVVRGTLESAWHLLTWNFVVLGGALLGALWLPEPGATVVALIVAATAAGYALVFLAVGLWRFGDVWQLPQWVLFVPMSGTAVAAAWVSSGTPPWLAAAAAITDGVLLVGIAVLHLMWAAGSTFPAADRGALAAAVIGGVPGPDSMPGRLATVAVAIGLVGAAWWTLMLAGVLASPLPATWLHVGGLAMIAIFGLRGLGGFFEVTFRPSIRGTPYMSLSRSLYSPLALMLATLVACAMLA